MSGCNKFLDRKPLDASASSTFLSNEAEIDLGLTGVYAAAFWTVANNIPLGYSIESTTDLAIRRTGNSEDLIAMGDAGPFLVSNGSTVLAWGQEYKLVARANQQLSGMKNGVNAMDPKAMAGCARKPWCYGPGPIFI